MLVALIWPTVILSATGVARGFGARGGGFGLILAGGAVVLLDASLIEPIAVRAGLWTWHEPGLFEVPPIGLLGWAIFGAIVIALFESNERNDRGPIADLAVLGVAPAIVHGALLAVWWGALRWVNRPLPENYVVIGGWVLSLGAAWLGARARPGPRLMPWLLASRVPAAAYFFVLLAWIRPVDPWLVSYAIAFVPPYLVATPGIGAIRLRR